MVWRLLRIGRPDYGGAQLIMSRDPGNPRAQTVMLYVHPQLASQFGNIDVQNPPQAVVNWVQGHLDTQDTAAAFGAKLSEAEAGFRVKASGKLDEQVDIIRQYLTDNPGVTAQQARAVLTPRAQDVFDAIDALTGGF